jgi:lysophospholipid acyltransferase (LPLAT)-like uncharacterized protein
MPEPSGKEKLTELKWRLVGILGRMLVHFIFGTSTLEFKGRERVEKLLKTRKYIWAVWHSRILMFSHVYTGLNASILVSASDDGEIIARILQAQGQDTVRGSTSRGGLRALSRMIKNLKSRAQPGAIIPDGPRGPRQKVQPGVIVLAKKTGYPIVPATYSARKAKIFGSWDRFMLPFPFNRCLMIYGNPVFVPADADQAGMEKCARELENELNRITAMADKKFGEGRRKKEE